MTVKSDNYQVGLDGTPANNFTIRTDGAGGFIISRGNPGATTQDIITVDAIGNLSSNTGALATTGDFKFVMLPAAPAGWIAGNGGTIGNVGSGATLASVTTQALFLAWWSYTDAQLPIYTSTGTLSARGASAAADWAANKRLTVFDVRDRVARAAGTIQPNGTRLEASRIVPAYTNGPLTTGVVPGGNQQAFDVDATTTINATYGTWTVTAQPAADLPAYRVRGASLGMLGCFKL